MLENCGLCSKQAAGSPDVMYSLWLMPKHDKLTCDETTVAESTDPTRNGLYSTARKIISQNNHPDQQFEPHVTLVGGLYNSSVQSLRDLCNRLVSELPGPCMKLDVCDAGHYHHTQCVYFKMVKGDGLRTLYERAQTLLSECAGVSLGVHGDVETYMPHMSLRYDCMAREDALKLCAGIERELASCEEFRTSVLELWDTTGPIGGWTCVGSYPFIHDEDIKDKSTTTDNEREQEFEAFLSTVWTLQFERLRPSICRLSEPYLDLQEVTRGAKYR